MSIKFSALTSELCQLNNLLEEQRFAEYWQRGLERIRYTAQAQAARLYLLEPIRSLGGNRAQVGDIPPHVASHIEQREEALSNLQTTTRMQTIQTGDWYVVHIPIVVDRLVRGALSLVMAVALTEAEHDPLRDAVQLYSGNALRAGYLIDAQARFERINLLYMITQDLTSSLDLITVLNQTTDMAASVLNAQASTLYRIDAENQELIFMITKGEAAHILEEKRLPIDHGVAGWVATHGESLIVNDAPSSPLFNSSMDAQTGFTTRNMLCVPLRTQERTVGVLQVMNKEDGTGFTDEDNAWLSVIGRQVAVALENAHLFAREQEKVSELATLNEVSQTINSELDVSVILDKITHCVLDILAADRSELLLLAAGGNQLELRSSAGYGAEYDGAVRRIPLETDLYRWYDAFITDTARGDEASALPVALWDDWPELRESAIIAAPLRHRERIVGIIVVYSLSQRTFDAEKRNLLQTFANQAAIAIQNAELYQNLRAEQERIIKAQEEVRHQLARNLHDNTAQMLSLIIMNLDLTRQSLLQQRYDKSLDEIDRLEDLARQANREVRTLLFELRPIILESRGLIPALAAYHRQLSTSMDCALHLDAQPLDFQIQLHGASTIFSIIQEAVNNIRKYANAANVWIRVYTDADYLRFEVEDDGVGFDLDETMREYETLGSFGLLNMRERAYVLDGVLNILSPRPGGAAGTLVSGRVPLRNLYSEDGSNPQELPALLNM